MSAGYSRSLLKLVQVVREDSLLGAAASAVAQIVQVQRTCDSYLIAYDNAGCIEKVMVTLDDQLAPTFGARQSTDGARSATLHGESRV